MNLKRDLNFEVNNSKQFNKMLAGVMMDARRGALTHEMVKSITLVADKMNKNGVNELVYKKISNHKIDIDFYQDGLQEEVLTDEK